MKLSLRLQGRRGRWQIAAPVNTASPSQTQTRRPPVLLFSRPLGNLPMSLFHLEVRKRRRSQLPSFPSRAPALVEMFGLVQHRIQSVNHMRQPAFVTPPPPLPRPPPHLSPLSPSLHPPHPQTPCSSSSSSPSSSPSSPSSIFFFYLPSPPPFSSIIFLLLLSSWTSPRSHSRGQRLSAVVMNNCGEQK